MKNTEIFSCKELLFVFGIFLIFISVDLYSAVEMRKILFGSNQKKFTPAPAHHPKTKTKN